MKFYNVNIAGVQKHIKGNSFDNQTAGQVSCIIMKYWDDEYCTMPSIENTMWQALSNDFNIEITEAN